MLPQYMALSQTWKKLQSCGHCPWKFLRFSEIFRLWKFVDPYFQKTPHILGSILSEVEYLAHTLPMDDDFHNNSCYFADIQSYCLVKILIVDQTCLCI